MSPRQAKRLRKAQRRAGGQPLRRQESREIKKYLDGLSHKERGRILKALENVKFE